jgi:competence ComEA-like helix-hairpin-helix protein
LDFADFENQIDVFLSYAAPDLENGERFDFDPNSATKEDFLRMGLSMKTVNGILSFREKGWKFYKPEDLEKVWEILPEEYEAVKDYIKIENSSSYSQTTYKKKTYDKKQSGELFEFDPNTAEKDEFEALGLKSWQADNIIKFREKGGVFRTPADFAKVYGIEPETFSKLEPYIIIDEETLPQANTVAKSNAIININSASEVDFQKLSGIGPAYSKRIVEYRTRLGGFISIDQIREVYGMTEELFESIKANLVLDEIDIKKVNINTAEYKDLVYHPYISKENAKNILNYRNFAGKIKSFDELLKQKAINKEFFDKLNPYITVE